MNVLRTILWLTVAGMLGCPSSSEDLIADFEKVLPAPEDLTLRYPGVELFDGPPKPTKPDFESVVGVESPAFIFGLKTMGFTTSGLQRALDPVRFMIEEGEPQLEDSNRVVWQATNKGMVFELTALKTSVGYYDYVLTVVPAGKPEAPPKVLIAGSQVPGPAGHSAGSVWVDLAKDGDSKTGGKVLAIYRHDQFGSEVTIHHYEYLSRVAKSPVTGSYRYLLRPDGSGSFDLQSESFNLYGPKEMLEGALIHIGWGTDGRGRSEVIGFGGDIAATGLARVHITNCWEAGTHLSTYVLTKEKTPGSVFVVSHEDGDSSSCYQDGITTPVIPGAPPEPKGRPWLDKLGLP